MKTYTFHVSLPGTGRVWRKIEMRTDQTLEVLHFAIQRAYQWDADHLYSFFMSGKAWDKATEYCLPEGVPPLGGVISREEEEEEPPLPPAGRGAKRRRILGEGLSSEMAAGMDAFWQDFFAREGWREPGDVRATTLEELDLEIGQTFLYLFDYGDNWRFKVRVHALNPDAPAADYPRVVESVGEAPEQYLSW